MEPLINGVHGFKHDVFPLKQELFQKLAKGQAPIALFITCADSRINPALITQTEPGELFIIRNAGNIIPVYGTSNGGEGATLEYAVDVLNVKMVVVCGHSDCGAMRALLNPDPSRSKTITDWLSRAEPVKDRVMREAPDASGEALLNHLIRENVLTQLDNIQTYPSVAAKLESGALTLHGCVYAIETGEISTYEADQDRFVPICELVAAHV